MFTLAAITPNYIIWDSIAIFIALDSLHKKFQLIITLLLYVKDKKLEEIQQIVTFIEVKLIAK